MSVIPIDVTEVSESPEIWPRWHTDRTSADLGALGRPGYELGPGRGVTDAGRVCTVQEI